MKSAKSSAATSLVRALPRFTHDYGSLVIEMIPFVCLLAAGSATPHPHEHLALAWATLETLNTFDLAPADLPVVAALRTPPARKDE